MFLRCHRHLLQRRVLERPGELDDAPVGLNIPNPMVPIPASIPSFNTIEIFVSKSWFK